MYIAHYSLCALMLCHSRFIARRPNFLLHQLHDQYYNLKIHQVIAKRLMFRIKHHFCFMRVGQKIKIRNIETVIKYFF